MNKQYLNILFSVLQNVNEHWALGIIRNQLTFRIPKIYFLLKSEEVQTQFHFINR